MGIYGMALGVLSSVYCIPVMLSYNIGIIRRLSQAAQDVRNAVTVNRCVRIVVIWIVVTEFF